MALRRRYVNMKVDESFFNEFDHHRRKAASRLGVQKISQQDFSSLLIKGGIFSRVKLFNNVNKRIRKKR